MKRLLHASLSLGLLLVLLTSITPVSAACKLNFTIDSDVGTTQVDIIVCGPGQEPAGDVSGYQGSDTIVVDGIITVFDVYGGNSGGFNGDDHILITDDATVGDVVGDNDISGILGGNDLIVMNGVSNTVYGDIVATTATTDTGGDDELIIGGTVGSGSTADDVIGDYVQDVGGDDTITVLTGARVYGDVIGDYLFGSNAMHGQDTIAINGRVDGRVGGDWSSGGSSHSGAEDNITIGKTGYVVGEIRGDALNGSGADDVIVIEGRVDGLVSGDFITNGNGGNDEIIVTETGDVNNIIAGDYLNDDFQNGNDVITIGGEVNEVRGDGNQGNAGSDDITVLEGGVVINNVYGDYIPNNRSTSSDEIHIHGVVRDNVIGDGLYNSGGTSNGKSDLIIVEIGGAVRDAIYGDHQTRRGGDGGNDLIKVSGLVGQDKNNDGVFGDKADGNGGNDFILIEDDGAVQGSVVGDDVNGVGGQDLIWIDGVVSKNVIGDAASGGNVKDQIAVRQTGLVQGSVHGDGTGNSANGGWDTINIIGGIVQQHVIGDFIGGNGGNDFIALRMNGSIGGDLTGDAATKNGGNDTLSVINGMVAGNLIGDGVSGDGGDDKINVLVAGTVKGNIYGDNVGTDKVGGDDSIFVAGTVDGRIYGDHDAKNAFAGKDTIQTSPSAIIGNGIWGDNAKGAGKNDIFKINGQINAGGVRGDVVNGKGGNDNISIFSLGEVTGNVIGDDANGAGGNDTILVDGGGKVTGHVWGDFSKGNGGNDNITIEGTVTGNVEGDHHKSGSSANGGDDTILVDVGGLVQGNVFGDNSPGAGGDDKIDIKGKVNGNVLGDNAGGSGGNDIIRIFPSGVVGGSVCGRNFCNNNPGDNVVFLDEDANPSLDSADTIIIAGKVLGNVIAGTFYGSNADDTVVVIEGAEIGGTVYAGDETNGDSFIYVENIINEEKTISEVVNSVTEKNGKVTVNGMTYTLDDVETVVGAVGQIACFGMDYRMNKASDGCSARSQSEKDAIEWHLNNPGNDGRLPGLEGCAVYPYGDALRVYEIMEGAEGQLVAEIWGDVLRDAPASNELLGATADGNVALYHLASGELQIECKNFVDGKTQVRVLSDLAGTVTGAYDKG